MEFKISVIFLLFLSSLYGDNFSFINLPKEHLPFYFTSFPDTAEKCLNDPDCPFKEHVNKKKHWGYQFGHKWGQQYSEPRCPGDHRGWVKSKDDQKNTFYTQADFGYIKQQLQELKILCEPLFLEDSSLECSEHLRYCRGRNIMINFTKLKNRTEPLRYKMDVLSDGDIGGYCKLNKTNLDTEADHISALQSWGPEMRFFTELQSKPINEAICDIVIEKPTYIMKLDASVNMYHHFCDFLNLYASQHMNPSSEAFSTDIHILIWETYTYKSAFQDTWKVFTNHPLWDLKTFRGDVVCFKDVFFPLLPRMIFGLYYNTPLIYGCEGSGLFHAFSKHILRRLKIPIHNHENNKIRITLLSRDTKYRRILNERALLKSIENNKGYAVKRVVYNRDLSFTKQLEITANTDVLIGIHGAGLTHLLFLPDWATVFELYNCEDPNCYGDLARLRGVEYVTWEDTDKLTSETDQRHEGAHAKFANYAFEPDEFQRLVRKAANNVKNHPKYKEFLKSSDQKHEEL